MTPSPTSAPAAPASSAPKPFGTFGGVFTPTLLTILGVIMYLRLPWVVGNAGLLGSALIMLVAMGITTATGLSLSSIATNTRLGAGGPYAIIARSFGLEVGGSVGVPLYLSQALAVAMYVFGFREGWNWIFPGHPAIVVDLERLDYVSPAGLRCFLAGACFPCLRRQVAKVSGVAVTAWLLPSEKRVMNTRSSAESDCFQRQR